MFWTVVVVWPAGSRVSGSTPMTMRIVSVLTLGTAAAVGAGPGAAEAAPEDVGWAAGAAGALVGLDEGLEVQAVSSTAPPAPRAAFRKKRRDTSFLDWFFSSTVDLLSCGSSSALKPNGDRR